MRMLTLRVLELFEAHQRQRLLTPDDIWVCLRGNLRRKTVSRYLSRLCRQGLVERGSCHPIAYRITPEGIGRLRLIQSKRV